MSSVTVYTCAWCGFTAPAESDELAEYLPKDWEWIDTVELCVGCVIARQLAIDAVKAERKDINKGRGVMS